MTLKTIFAKQETVAFLKPIVFCLHECLMCLAATSSAKICKPCTCRQMSWRNANASRKLPFLHLTLSLVNLQRPVFIYKRLTSQHNNVLRSKSFLHTCAWVLEKFPSANADVFATWVWQPSWEEQSSPPEAITGVADVTLPWRHCHHTLACPGNCYLGRNWSIALLWVELGISRLRWEGRGVRPAENSTKETHWQAIKFLVLICC